MEIRKSRKNDKVSVLFMQLALLLTVILIASNIFETKEIGVFGPINVTGGLLVFPLAYVICRIICEVYGFQRTCLLIWTGFLLNFLLVAMAGVVDVLPGVGDPEIARCFHVIFGFSARITIASCLAFLAGSFVSAYFLSRRKASTKGAGLSGRFALSALAGEAADSLLFFPIAFIGVLPAGDLLGQMIVQFVFKTLYEIALSPASVPIVKQMQEFDAPQDEWDERSYGLFDIFRRK